ncbi:glyoxylate/hydroxypyruvate reductase A-like isoform X2 [Biomphalaria glabrata]|uniref:Glyoxylate/hydroxypyruvate reductase A-like isoform X2 n=1 Tax=Biomphalaria glabrata TaxID=6526 RepID=A0A9W3A9C3_BIOGL|nr:glyoxylate/hydroxypyruvate reductase A-like isoform X2 [Biomphalaria glabrata]
MSAYKKVAKVFVASRVQNLANILRTSTSDIVVEECSLSQNPENQLEKHVSEIEFLFADPDIIGQVLAHPRNKVKWAQSTFAGLDALFKAIDKLHQLPDVLISRQTGGFGQKMGEYVIGQIIARERKFDIMRDLQKQKSFDGSQLYSYRCLNSLSIGILGFGTIGQEVVRQCKAMNMNVWAAVRDERFDSGENLNHSVDNFVPMSRLNEMLTEVDYLVNVLPSTPKTRGLLSDKLHFCEKKKTIFINIGRGDIVDDNSLITAIQNGWLGGAILDVFNTEPLPSTSELWNLPNVTISPHVSGITFAVEVCGVQCFGFSDSFMNIFLTFNNEIFQIHELNSDYNSYRLH